MENEENNSSLSSKGPILKRNPFSRFVLLALKGSVGFYRNLISPMLPPSCRFYPTCSAYALEALEKYGPWKGTQLALKRISRCHPWNPGGHDPVP